MNKKIIQLIGEIIIVGSLMSLMLTAHAFAATSSVGDIIQGIGNETGLPDFGSNPHAGSPEGVNTGSTVKGIGIIASTILSVADFFKYALGSVAVFLLIMSGVKLVMAGEQAEEELKKQKEYFKYAIIGFLLIIIAQDVVQNVFYGQAGEAYSSGENAATFASYGAAEIKGIYSFIEVFLGVTAVFYIIYEGMILITSTTDDAVTKARQNIMYGIVGLIIVGLAELVVKDIVFAGYGSDIDVEKAKSLFASLTNFVSSTMATIAVAMLFYAGYSAVTSWGNEEGVTKAKKIAIMAVAGLILAGAAYAIANTLTDFMNG